MRVIAGSARRLQLKTVPGTMTRPTTDRIRETLFNMLQNDIAGARFLDLFAGSGAIGIEALSRGARSAVFVEADRRAFDCIRQNLETTHFQDTGTVIRADVVRAIQAMDREGTEPFDLIFMDPPYEKMLENQAMEALKHSTLITEDTLIIIEASLKTDFTWLREDPFWLLEKEKKYKTNQHVFVRKG